MGSELPLEISVVDTKTVLEAEAGTLLLDCRNQDEFDFVHLEGAKLIPMDELTERVEELGTKDTRVIVYCHMGVRSNMVCQWLRNQGFAASQSMAGGIDAWSMQVDSSLPRY